MHPVAALVFGLLAGAAITAVVFAILEERR
jgi:hypothetical protein